MSRMYEPPQKDTDLREFCNIDLWKEIKKKRNNKNTFSPRNINSILVGKRVKEKGSYKIGIIKKVQEIWYFGRVIEIIIQYENKNRVIIFWDKLGYGPMSWIRKICDKNRENIEILE